MKGKARSRKMPGFLHSSRVKELTFAEMGKRVGGEGQVQGGRKNSISNIEMRHVNGELTHLSSKSSFAFL